MWRGDSGWASQSTARFRLVPDLKTFTSYTGLDPEVGSNGGSGQNGSGSALVNATDAFGFPTLRTFTVSLSTRF